MSHYSQTETRIAQLNPGYSPDDVQAVAALQSSLLAQHSGKTESSQPTVITIDVSLLATLVDCAASHVEDIETGIEEGLYSKAENADLGTKQAAVEVAQALLRTPSLSPSVASKSRSGG